MEKGKNYGIYSFIAKSGKPKSRWETDKEAIENAKYLNKKYPKDNSKLVAYKCPNCHKYHLKTNYKNVQIKRT